MQRESRGWIFDDPESISIMAESAAYVRSSWSLISLIDRAMLFKGGAGLGPLQQAGPLKAQISVGHASGFQTETA